MTHRISEREVVPIQLSGKDDVRVTWRNPQVGYVEIFFLLEFDTTQCSSRQKIISLTEFFISFGGLE
jgi:hypothetical protein